MNNFSNILALINKAYSRGYNKVLLKSFNKNNFILLQTLVTDGLIISYKIYKNIAILYINNKLKTKPTINISTKLNTKSISLDELRKNAKKNGFSSYYYLNTDKGILNSYDAINKNIGGKILFKII